MKPLPIQRFTSVKTFLFIAALASLATTAEAAVTFTNTFNVSTAIPDNDDTGYVSDQTITAGEDGVPPASEILFITHVTVALNFTDGWNGDIYVYLVHDTGFSVLLNRIGRSAENPDGNATSGMSITLDDDAPTNVHEAPTTLDILTGIYRADGSLSDPDSLTFDDLGTAGLSNLNGLNAAGNWTLFVADVSPGDQTTLESWSITVTAVPEPAAALLSAVSFSLLLRRRRC